KRCCPHRSEQRQCPFQWAIPRALPSETRHEHRGTEESSASHPWGTRPRRELDIRRYLRQIASCDGYTLETLAANRKHLRETTCNTRRHHETPDRKNPTVASGSRSSRSCSLCRPW